jgi:hypothetical protein
VDKFSSSLKGSNIAYDNEELSSGLSATFSHSLREQEKGITLNPLLSSEGWEKLPEGGMRALSHPMR